MTAAPDLDLANRFRAALAGAVQTGDLEPVYEQLATDVEWITPQRTLQGINEIREEPNWISPSETFDLEVSGGERAEEGSGRFVVGVHEVYRLKETGALGYARDRRVELKIGGAKISRYEMRIIG